MNYELKQRLTFSAIGIPLLLVIFYLGGWFLWTLLLVISALGMKEFSSVLSLDLIKPKPKAKPLEGIVYVLLSLMVFGYMTLSNHAFWSPLYLVAGLLLASVIMLISLGFKRSLFTKRVFTGMGIIYTMFFPGLIYFLDKQYHNEQLLLLLLVLIWITDSAAYFIGVRFGKHRGIFPMSPNKSLEGFIAGLVAPFALLPVFYQLNSYWTITQVVYVCLCAGLVGQMGDLLESKLKRIGGVKDSSHLIPGHGGVLDRFDSLLLAAPVLYIALRILS